MRVAEVDVAARAARPRANDARGVGQRDGRGHDSPRIRAAETFAGGWTAHAEVDGQRWDADRRGEDASAAVLQVASDVAHDLDTEGAEIVAPGQMSRDEFARMSEVWSLRQIVARLADATAHLLDDHDCDAHGHEEARYAHDAAREWLAKVSS